MASPISPTDSLSKETVDLLGTSLNGWLSTQPFDIPQPESPHIPDSSPRSRSADHLESYPALKPKVVSVKDRVAQVQANAPMVKPKSRMARKGKLASSSSLSRRNSAPLSTPYHRPGISPASWKPSSQAGQLSTFGTVYVPALDESRTDSENSRFNFSLQAESSNEIFPSKEEEEELGGVHYSTYGGRTSQVYDAPFADVGVPVPAEFLPQLEQIENERGHKRVGSQVSQVTAALLRRIGVESPTPEDKEPRSRKLTISSMIPASQSHITLGAGTEQTHGTTSQEDTTLISMSKFPMPPLHGADPKPDTPTSARPNTPGSMVTVQPGTPTLPGGRPTTPAIPDFLAASRSTPSGSGTNSPQLNTEAEGGTSSGSATPQPRLRTRSSLLALALRRDSSNSPLTGHESDSSKERGSSNPRRRSLLERLASRITGPSALGQDNDDTWIDESDLEEATEELTRGWVDAAARRRGVTSPVLDFDLSPQEPLIDMEQFGMLVRSSSPVRANATYPPDPIPISPPTSPRRRTLSKLSFTGRKAEGRPTTRRTVSVFSSASRGSRRSRKHARGTSNDSGLVRAREGGRLESLTRRASADMLTAEGSIEGTVMYGVGEEMLRLMFGGAALPGEDQGDEPNRQRTRSLPRRVVTPRRAKVPRADLVVVAAKSHEAEADENDTAGLQLLPDFGGSLDLRFSNPTMTLPSSAPAPAPAPAVSHIRRKGHRRGTASASKENVILGAKNPKSRSRSKSVPLGLAGDLERSLTKPTAGILTNGGTLTNLPYPNRASRVVIVGSAVMTTPRKQRQAARSMDGALAVASGSGSGSGSGSQTLVQPGVVVTAPTPPAPQRSLSVPLEALPTGDASAPSSAGGVESPRGTVSRGTSVQFVPESYKERRRSTRSRKEGSGNISTGTVPEVNGNGSGKGKRKVEREPMDAPDSSVKKPRLSAEEMEITFMGERLFDGRPSRRSGLGSVASSHHSGHSRRSQSHYPPPPLPYPTPTASPDPERASIPIHAIVTPRVQSLYGTGPDFYSAHRQSISSVQRPKSRASARSNATGAAKSTRSARSNVTGARSTRTGASVGPKNWKDRLPFQGWCFLAGFVMPLVWWYAAFARAERGYYGGGIWSRDVESQWEGVRTSIHRDDGRIDAHTWRFRCRLMAAFSIVVYVPVIVLAAVFA